MIEITDDMYGIVKAIKYIDAKYRVFYDKRKNQYCLFYKNGLNIRKELVFPFESLDRRAVNYVHKTMKKDIEKLIKEIDEHNSNIEDRANNKIKENAVMRAKERR